MLVLMFDAIRLFWQLLCKSLFQDFVSCNFPKNEELIRDGVGFSLYFIAGVVSNTNFEE